MGDALQLELIYRQVGAGLQHADDRRPGGDPDLGSEPVI
jgi:hypothetical protein